MEPHATLVAVRGGTITVWTCSQEVFELRTVMAALFGVPESKMRVICTKVGGGFGGKIEPRLEPITIALALKSGKPVKIVMTRTEEFTACCGVDAGVGEAQDRRHERRHPYRAGY